ncbi:MAG TPA: toll/interleukin-1 receptor domain-containing protein, partial [Myxococcota bacterium]|nr:toll/interleukin-1 receptor domain-containing protein [Myxococcota bacterium]
MAAVPRLILAHASEAPGAVVRHLFDRFVRDVREPWEPSIGLELRVARTDDPTRGPRAPLPLTQDPGLRDDDVVVLLVDDRWIAEASYERPDAWRAFEASLAGRSVLAVALSAGAFAWIGRMPGLSGAQTIQAAHLADDAARAREVAYRLAFTLLTRLAGEADRPPLTLFVSHAKRDGLGPAGEILRHLAVANPVKAWFDANDLRAGDAFRDAFDRAIETSMLLVVWTDHYTTRPWCRWELATARELRRPILVVDALERGHQRLSPLLAGLPVVRWTGRPGDAVDAAVFEALRFRVAELRAGAQRCDGELRDDAWRARE